MGLPLAAVKSAALRLSQGWAFSYQSRSYVESGDFRESLVGHGPVVILDDGRVLEGGSLDGRDPERIIARAVQAGRSAAPVMDSKTQGISSDGSQESTPPPATARP